jgi:hypothetical protein
MLKKIVGLSKTINVMVFKNFNRFSAVKKITLSEVEQKAVIAYFAFNFITEFDMNMYLL